jgi:hypothetical protein
MSNGPNPRSANSELAQKSSEMDRREFLAKVGITAGVALGSSLLGTGCLSTGPSVQDLENAFLLPAGLGVTNPAHQGEIKGFASRASVNRGESIQLFVHSIDPSYTVEVFRTGWYGGAGVKSMMAPVRRVGKKQAMPVPDSPTGLIECQWSDPFVLDIPNSNDPGVWPSGVYVAKLTGSVSGKQSCAIFVVRDDARDSDLLFQSSVTTFQAYNHWGGLSLYTSPRRAYEVSFNRPYLRGFGTGDFFFWEYSMVQFLEREGFDVTYSTDVDTHARGQLLQNHKGFLSVGHDEYWSNVMRDNVEDARDAGVNLGFFGSNICYWHVRFTHSLITGDANRTMICYKDINLDPMGSLSDPTMRRLSTVRFRESPVNRSEEALLGVMFEARSGSGNIMIENANHWVFEGTGLRKGDLLYGLVGYEADRMFGGGPPGVERIAHSRFSARGVAQYSDMAVYTAPSGSTVVATGSMQWNWGLSDFELYGRRYTNPAAQQATRNILKKFGALPGRGPIS